MTESEWARTSLTVWHGTAEPRVRDVDVGSLEEQLLVAQSWLDEILAAERAQPTPDLEVRLFCSWAPAVGQRAMTLPAALVRALAAVNGTYWMDVYPPEPETGR